MAVLESCSDSLRASFSYDFGPPDALDSVENQTIQSCSLSNVGSEFCFQRNQESFSTTADKLFSDGKILPVQIIRKTDNNVVSSKQKQQFPPLQTYLLTNSSRPFPPLHHLLYGAKTSATDEKYQSSFEVKTGASNGEEHSQTDFKSSRRCPMKCFGLKISTVNGGFRPFPLVFRSYSVKRCSKMASLPRNNQMDEKNRVTVKERRCSSPVNVYKRSSLKQLIEKDHKIKNRVAESNRKACLKELIMRDDVMD